MLFVNFLKRNDLSFRLAAFIFVNNSNESLRENDSSSLHCTHARNYHINLLFTYKFNKAKHFAGQLSKQRISPRRLNTGCSPTRACGNSIHIHQTKRDFPACHVTKGMHPQLFNSCNCRLARSERVRRNIRKTSDLRSKRRRSLLTSTRSFTPRRILEQYTICCCPSRDRARFFFDTL